jgi:hypothetical protein
MELCADLIVPGADLYEVARNYPLKQLRGELARAAEVAVALGMRKIWREARLCGTNTRRNPPYPDDQAPGLSLTCAPIAGVGFVYEYEIDPRLQPRKNRRESLREVASTMRARVPVEVALDVTAKIDVPFEPAYRRQMAYALGFEASLRAGSMEPYESRMRALSVGSVDELVAALPAVQDPLALSICLNLAMRLQADATHEHEKGMARRGSHGEIVDAGRKRAILDERIAQASALMHRQLTVDGRIALEALHAELKRFRESGVWVFLRQWGTDDVRYYQSTDDPEEDESPGY